MKTPASEVRQTSLSISLVEFNNKGAALSQAM
jgi:hypothetical protein